MATKKQKHEAALARREAFLAEEREIGKKALEKAQRDREKKHLEAWAKGHEKHHKFVDECPHCDIVKKKQVEAARVKAIEKIAKATVPNGDEMLLENLVPNENNLKHLAKEDVLSLPMVMMVNFESAHPPIEGIDALTQPFSNKAST